MKLKAKRSGSSRLTLLEAAKAVVRKSGYAGLSTRDVALEADMPLSQIHYHFGSKDGLVLALFEHLNDQLLSRQEQLFGSPELPLSAQWRRACDYLDEDLASGYVRILQELWAAGYSNPEIAEVVRRGLLKWQHLLTELATRAQRTFGSMGDLPPDQIASLVGTAFIGSEAFILIGLEKKGVPVRKSLRAIGDILAALEKATSKR